MKKSCSLLLGDMYIARAQTKPSTYALESSETIHYLELPLSKSTLQLHPNLIFKTHVSAS